MGMRIEVGSLCRGNSFGLAGSAGAILGVAKGLFGWAITIGFAQFGCSSLCHRLSTHQC